MIDALNLTKRYGEHTVVGGLTFTVRPGTVTGFLGPNGAGKSTTLRMMLGLTRPDEGSARIGGHAYQDLRHPARHVGALLETSVPHKSLTAVDHLRWLARSNRIPRRRVDEVLDAVGLTGAARRRVGTFSLGMGQRLGLAAALLGDPPVLMLDEPVNGLDAEGIRWLRELLRGRAAEGRTVLVSSHLMAEMSMVADHLVVIDRGRLLADTGMQDFIQRHGRSYVRVRTPQPGPLSRELERKGASLAAGSDGSLEVSGLTAGEVSQVAAAGGLALDELSTHTASLEDTFLGLVGKQHGQQPEGSTRV
ncbi:ABC transporter ATP-binding protein [Streptomyces sp. VRA16 Mangrove soil]|uniref:ABC transporter ATP-binding protein n=1 Tax=Streptomyces sp. VRA16 Mangrove soil TaxID=2817434 RepID=UPI001A9FE53E|nr:ATP-binding cassette domain-containing protein [Streptomyces sp. VRA16 Mangrove soil]MBO1337236.1 ATP-binding cassette domain-containing protein [Streptomyces sp. VRA16 Mangrove soil]